MNHDPVALLEKLRPDEREVHACWPEGSEVLERILGTRRPRSYRGYVAGAAGIAAAAVVVAVLPGTTSSSELPNAQPAAVTSALHRLAAAAAATPFDPGDGAFWHMVVQQRQYGDPSQPDSTSRLESWLDGTGREWRHDTSQSAGSPAHDDYFEFAPGADDVNVPSPAYLRTLPTTENALYDYLDQHVSGSSSHEEAIFVAIGDMLRGGFAPPALREAAIEVLTQLPHVSLGDTTVDALGRAVQQFCFIDQSIGPDEVDSLYFDPRTAQIIDEGDTSPQLTFLSSVVTADSVDAVPPDVLSRAVLQH